MTRSLSFIITLMLFLPQLQADVIARLIKVEGNVYFKRMGMETFSEKAKLGAAIMNGDAIKVGETGFGAIIYLDDRTILKIRENTKFSFMETQNTRTVDLTHGTLLNNVKSEGRTKSFRIQTPVSVASVKGTQFAAIVSQTGVDQFIGKEGLFEVLNMISGETVSVGPGQKAISNATGNLVQAPASPEDYPNDPEVEEYQEPEVEDVDESAEEGEQIFEYAVVVRFDNDYASASILEINWNQFLEIKRWHSVMRAWNIPVNNKLIQMAKEISVFKF